MTSKATKRKHVIREVLDDYVLPKDDQMIVKVMSSCGNNLHQVVTSKGEQFLVSMPTKFRRNVWIKRDDYVLITPIDEGDKVKAEITAILYKEQIKHIQQNNMWPLEFSADKSQSSASGQLDDDLLPPSYSDSDEEGEEEGAGLIGAGNPNRPSVRPTADEEDSDSDED